jgi:hypothetical protein
LLNFETGSVALSSYVIDAMSVERLPYKRRRLDQAGNLSTPNAETLMDLPTIDNALPDAYTPNQREPDSTQANNAPPKCQICHEIDL